MLPVYNDSVHHRHGQQVTGTARVVHNLLGMVPRHRRALFKRFLQGLLLLCLVLPVVLLISHQTTWRLKHRRHSGAGGVGVDEGLVAEGASDAADDGAAAGSGEGGTKALGGRKMMVDPVRLPGANLKHLVLVAGHAVYVGRDYSEAKQESSWFLEEYQKVEGEAASFVEHIELGIREAAKDPDAMLLFSGGQTRLDAGPRSEGLSYWVVAEAAGWFNMTGVRERTFTEEHARDSFENLMFSLCRFYELSGHYPDMVTVVSYNLKRARFKEMHRAAINFPDKRFRFVGSNLPKTVKGAQEGEANTVEMFKSDPYGCAGDLLQKRLRRDPFAVGPPHPSRCPEMMGLLQHCSDKMYKGPVPWVQP